MELKHSSKTLPGGHFKTLDGTLIKETFAPKPSEIYIVNEGFKMSSGFLGKGVAITLAFKNAKATFYRVVPQTLTA